MPLARHRARGASVRRWQLPLRGAPLWALSIACFLGVAVLEATHARIGYGIAGEPVFGLTLRGQSLSWFDFLARTTPSWLIVGVLAPLIIAGLRRFPIEGAHWRRHVVLHLSGAVLFSVAYMMCAAALRYHLFLKGEVTTTYVGLVIRYYTVYFNTFFLIYWAVVAVHTAFRYHSRHRDALILERDLAEARLQSIQAQLRPHFLFNALNAITTLAREGRRETVVPMLTTLAELLRASFTDPGTQFVRLGDELAFVRRYLDLERLRFPDRLSVDVRLEPGTEDIAVPRFVLQPLVENAVHHGVAVSNRAGRVSIASYGMPGAIELRVDDTGPGPAPDAVEGTGLGNTRRRLAHAFGGSAALELGRLPDGGCRATVRMPVEPDARVAAGC